MSTDTNLNQLEQIKKITTVVADTADFESIREFKPQDATTNPSLVYAATQKENYSHFLEEVLADRRKSGLSGAAQIEDIIDHLLVRFGSAMLEIVPGRVSTETDVRYSFDVEGSIKKARRLIALYKEQGIERERVLIKIASTWEGLMAAEQLQKEGIKCNMTLLFSLPQAVRAAEAKVQLISPFVGRIYDWFKAANKRDYAGAEDPGVQSVQEIYTYYKHFGYETEVMGASFRNVGQILELAGCDLLTISPELMKQLSESYDTVDRKLTPENAKSADVKRLETGRKEVPLSSQRKRNGNGENRGRNSQICGRYCETGKVRCPQDWMTKHLRFSISAQIPVDASLEFDRAQPQRVCDHRNRTETHRRAGDHRTEQHAEERIKHAGRDRHAERVVDEREEQILPDVAHHRAAEANALARCRADRP